MTRLSQTINGRNESLAKLLKGAADVTGILSQRSQQVNTLLLDANTLTQVLDQRRYAIVNLLANTSALSQQLSGLVHDNEQELAPTLQQLNSVTAMLEKNRDNIAAALAGLAKYLVTQGESVNNGFYYNSYVGNLLPSETLQPFLDYAFGFRRGTNAGQPPRTTPDRGPNSHGRTTAFPEAADDRATQGTNHPHHADRVGGVGLGRCGTRRAEQCLRPDHHHGRLHLGHGDLSR